MRTALPVAFGREVTGDVAKFGGWPSGVEAKEVRPASVGGGRRRMEVGSCETGARLRLQGISRSLMRVFGRHVWGHSERRTGKRNNAIRGAKEKEAVKKSLRRVGFII